MRGHHQCTLTGRHGQALPRLIGRLRQRQAEREHAAHADTARYFQPPPHHGNQSGRNGQSQAGTAVAPGGGVVCLQEGFENHLLLFSRDAGASVTHGEMHMAVTVGYDPQFHFTMISEFHGIADQVDQHLTQAGRVADDHCGYVGLDRQQKFDTFFLRFDGQHAHDIRAGGRNPKRRLLQAEATGLDLGEVQYIIDQSQQ